MVVVCTICGISSLEKKLKMFLVPPGEHKRWNKACNKEFGKWSKVCELHFEKDCFKRFHNITRLQPGSVPTLFLSSTRTAGNTNILQDAPPTTGFKNLQSKVQTVCLPSAQSGSTTTSIQGVTSTSPILTKAPAQCAAVTTSSRTKPPEQCAALTMPSVTKPPVQCVALRIPSLAKPPAQCAALTTSNFAKLPPSLTITPSFKNPLPPIEFVSVNTPIKPLKSEIPSAPLLSQRLQIRTLLNPIPLENQLETASVKKPTPVKLEIQKFNIPCKITKIDPSQIKSQHLIPHISTSVTHNNGNRVDFGTQTTDEIIAGGTYLENLKLKSENHRLKAEITQLKNKIEIDLYQNRNVAKLFTANQMRKLRSPNTHISWAWEDICWAITLQAAGPRAYKHLYHKGFPIPCITTLQRWIRNIKFDCGILTQVIDILKDIAELQTDDRVCVLCFDEIELSPSDNVDANITQRQFAQVAIVRGLKSPWKQPVFYDFNCIMSKSVIMNIISDLYAAGFDVVAMVAKLDNDQILLDELEISKDKNWFEHPCDKNAKIFTFIDAPQLLNLIRNQFIDGGFIFKEKLISSYNIQQILLNRLNESKLNNIHLEIKNFGREKTRMATQLFSKTTANALLKYKTNDSIDCNNAVECAKFIKLIDDWFDIFSSSPCCISTKKAFGLSLESQKKIIKNINEVMEQNVIPNSGTSLIPFQDGILLTNKSLCDLYDYVKDKYKIEYILTFRLNQDILETFFDSLRGDDPALQHLNPNEFQQSLRKYLFAGNVRHFRKNFKDLASESNDLLHNNENADDNSEEETIISYNISYNKVSDEHSAEDRTLSRCLIPNNFGHNNTLEDCLMDAGIESIHEDEDEEKYMEDYVMSELILEDL